LAKYNLCTGRSSSTVQQLALRPHCGSSALGCASVRLLQHCHTLKENAPEKKDEISHSPITEHSPSSVHGSHFSNPPTLTLSRSQQMRAEGHECCAVVLMNEISNPVLLRSQQSATAPQQWTWRQCLHCVRAASNMYIHACNIFWKGLEERCLL
jgi:hypothetical protein